MGHPSSLFFGAETDLPPPECYGALRRLGTADRAWRFLQSNTVVFDFFTKIRG